MLTPASSLRLPLALLFSIGAFVGASGGASPLSFSTKDDEPPVLACPPLILMGHFPHQSTIVWRTDVPCDSWVDYGPTPAYGLAAGEDEQVLLHQVTLTNLQPGCTYYYRLRGAGAELTTASFRSGKNAGQPVRVGLMADHRGGRGGPIAAVMESVKPDLILDAGDLADWCDLALLESQFFTVFANVLGQCPLYWSPGNHEGTACGPLMRTFAALPEDHQSYSIEYGDLQVISINAVDPPSTNWLREKLAGSSRPWRIVVTHYPMYSAEGCHGPWDGSRLREEYLPIMEQYRVTAVLAGHNHYYWRGHPTNGVTHLVAGSGGAPTYWLGSLPPYTAASNDTDQVIAFADLEGDMMHLRALNQNSNLVDEFVFDRACPFIMDGVLDDTAFLIASENGMNLYAALGGSYLYVAVTDIADGDLFVFLSRTLRDSLNTLAGWPKTGEVMVWDYLLFGHGASLSNGWFDAEAAPLSNLRIARAATRLNKDGVLEGVLDLRARFGEVPPTLHLAAGVFSPEPGGGLLQQCPLRDNQDGLGPQDFASLSTSSIQLPEPGLTRLVARPVEGGFLLQAQGPPHALHAFEVSTDLKSWRLLQSVPAPEDGPAECLDTEAPLWNARFYRTRRLWP